MDRKMQEKLKNFDAVWKRVSEARCPQKPMPQPGPKPNRPCGKKGKGRYCF